MIRNLTVNINGGSSDIRTTVETLLNDPQSIPDVLAGANATAGPPTSNPTPESPTSRLGIVEPGAGQSYVWPIEFTVPTDAIGAWEAIQNGSSPGPMLNGRPWPIGRLAELCVGKARAKHFPASMQRDINLIWNHQRRKLTDVNVFQSLLLTLIQAD